MNTVIPKYPTEKTLAQDLPDRTSAGSLLVSSAVPSGAQESAAVHDWDLLHLDALLLCHLSYPGTRQSQASIFSRSELYSEFL